MRVEHCARRHKLANEPSAPSIGGDVDLRDSMCRTCPTGATNEELVQPVILRKAEAIAARKPLPLRTCTSCKREYRPTGAKQKVCGQKNCPAYEAKKGPEPAAATKAKKKTTSPAKKAAGAAPKRSAPRQKKSSVGAAKASPKTAK